MDGLSMISPVGMSASTCGYCGPPGERSAEKGSVSYGIWAHQLTPQAYQDLIDRGWRRSGSYCYHPDNSRTCCPQHPIRLNASSFKASRSQRRALAAFRLAIDAEPASSSPSGSSSKYSQPFDVVQAWQDIESEPAAPTTQDAKTIHLERARLAFEWRKARKAGLPDVPAAPSLPHVNRGKRSARLKVTLVQGKATKENFALFTRYQMGVHRESEDKVTRKGFERFLCQSPIKLGAEEELLGLKHHEYRLDGQLIAVGVLDILPRCVSSVYLFYDPAFAHLQLGKISALREIALVEQLRRQRPNIEWYYMGYYIPTCQKMAYKAEFAPSQVLDMGTNEWQAHREFLARSAAAPRLERLSLPSSADADADADDDEDIPFPSPPPLGFLEPETVEPAGTLVMRAGQAPPDYDIREVLAALRSREGFVIVL